MPEKAKSTARRDTRRPELAGTAWIEVGGDLASYFEPMYGCSFLKNEREFDREQQTENLRKAVAALPDDFSRMLSTNPNQISL